MAGESLCWRYLLSAGQAAHSPLQLRRSRIVVVLANAPGLQLVYKLIDHKERQQKPLPGLDGLPKAVLDLDFQLGGCKKAMDQVFQFDPMDVG